MKPEFELALARECLRRGAYNRNANTENDRVRFDIDRLSRRLGFHEKQAHATLEKWTGKGWYDYGVSLDNGWLTPEGVAHFSKAIKEALPG